MEQHRYGISLAALMCISSAVHDVEAAQADAAARVGVVVQSPEVQADDGLPAIAGAVLEVPAATEMVAVRTLLRHVTVIVLPPSETIVDAVVGDAERWSLTSAANVAFIKPLEAAATSNVALVCTSGQIYSFRVVETVSGEPHLMVRVTAGLAPADAQAFVSTADIVAAEDAAAAAAAAVAEAEATAAERIAAADAALRSTVSAAREAYPRALRFIYEWEDAATAAPFFVQAMWHDETFTYLRSAAPAETMWLEVRISGQAPELVTYEDHGNGLWVAPRVLGPGWLELDDTRAVWRVGEEIP